MKEFTYTIKDELGIHARPAGLIVKEAKKFNSKIMITKDGEKTAEASRLMALMTLGVKCGNEVNVTAEGEDEEAAIDAMKILFEENL